MDTKGNKDGGYAWIILAGETLQSTKLIIGLNTGLVIRVTRRVSIVEQELLILHLSSPPFVNWVRVVPSLDFCILLVYHCLSFFFGHCIVCPSLIMDSYYSLLSSYF